MMATVLYGGGGGKGGSTVTPTPAPPTYTTKTINVYEYWDDDDNPTNCDAASIQMALDYNSRQNNNYNWNMVDETSRGIPSQSTIMQYIYSTNINMSSIQYAYNWFMAYIPGIKTSFSTVYTYYTDDAALNYLIKFINNSQPAIAQFNWDQGSQHTVVIYGYKILAGSTTGTDIDTVYYWDPYKNFTVSDDQSDWINETIMNGSFWNYVSKAGQ
jgi:hypothetical protein